MDWRRPQRPFHTVAAFCASLRNLQAAARPSWRGREGGKVLPCSPGGIFLHLRKRWVGDGAGPPSAGLGMAQSWCECSPVTQLCTTHRVMPWNTTVLWEPRQHRSLGSTGSLLSVHCRETLRCLSHTGPDLAQCFGAFISECLLHLAAMSSFYYIWVLEIGIKHPALALTATK